MSETIFDSPVEFSKLNAPAGTAVHVNKVSNSNDALFHRESKSFIKTLSWPNRGGSEPKSDDSTK